MTSQAAKKSTKGTAKKSPAKKTQSKKEPALADPFKKTKKTSKPKQYQPNIRNGQFPRFMSPLKNS